MDWQECLERLREYVRPDDAEEGDAIRILDNILCDYDREREERERTWERLKTCREMFDTTRHRILKKLGEDDMGKAWTWVEGRIIALVDARAEMERMWASHNAAVAFVVANGPCEDAEDDGESAYCTVLGCLYCDMARAVDRADR